MLKLVYESKLKDKLQNNFHLFTSKRFSLQKIIAKGLARQFWHFVQTGGFKCRCRAVWIKANINKLKPEHYQVGEKLRANFHLHTIASDGRLTPKEFLKQCTSYANRVFKSGKANDNLPAFSAAITDYDRVKSSQEVIVLISQEPGKYKNFKFVAGCEFLLHGYKEPHPAFEAVGLGFNLLTKLLRHWWKVLRKQSGLGYSQNQKCRRNFILGSSHSYPG